MISSFITTTNSLSLTLSMSHLHRLYYPLIILPPGHRVIVFHVLPHWTVSLQNLFGGREVSFGLQSSELCMHRLFFTLGPMSVFWGHFSSYILVHLKARSCFAGTLVCLLQELFQILNLPSSTATLLLMFGAVLARRWKVTSSLFSKLESWHNLITLAWKQFWCWCSPKV